MLARFHPIAVSLFPLGTIYEEGMIPVVSVGHVA
jgi:hypothetical protein